MDELTDEQLRPQQLPVVLPSERPAAAPAATATTPGETGVLPGSLRDQVYRAYIEGDGSEGPKELADRFGVPFLEVLQWFRIGRWVQTRKEFTSVAKEQEEQAYCEFASRGRLEAAIQQAKTGAELELLVNKTIEDAKNGMLFNSRGEAARLSPGMLKTLAEGAATAASLRARVFGLTDKAAVDAAARAAAAEVPQRLGLIVLDRTGPSGPVPVAKPIIDVTPEVRLQQ